MAGRRTSVIQVMITGDAKDLDRATRSGSQGMSLLGAAAVTAAKVVSSAVSAIAGFSIREFAKFDSAMVKSTAIMGDLTDVMRKDMADAARQVALSTTFAADEAAEAFFFLASAGLTAEQSIAALPQVAAFAQAGAFDLARATDLLTDAQSALGMTSEDTAEHLAELGRVSDVLVRANTLANASVEQFSAALTNKAGAALRIMNKEVEEGVAALALLADRGVKGTEAGEKLSIMLRDVTRAAARSPQAFRDLGLEILDTEGNLRNIADVTDEFTRVLGGMSDAQAATTLESLGLTRSVGDVIRTMFEGGDQIREYEAALRDAGGATEEIAQKQLQSFSAQLSLLRSAFSDVGITIGAALAGPLSEFVSFMQTQMPGIKRFFEEEFTPAFEEFVDTAKVKFAEFRVFFNENLREPLENFKTALVGFGQIGRAEFSTLLERVRNFAADFKAAIDENDPDAAGEALGELIAETFRQAFQRAGIVGDAIKEWAGGEDWEDIGRAVGALAVPFFTGFVRGMFSKPEDADAEFDTVAKTLSDRFVSTVIGAAVLSKVPIFGGIFRLMLSPIRLGFAAVGARVATVVTPVMGSVLLGALWAAVKGAFAALGVLLGGAVALFGRFVATPLMNAFRSGLAALPGLIAPAWNTLLITVRGQFRAWAFRFGGVAGATIMQAIGILARAGIRALATAVASFAVAIFGWPLVLIAAVVAALTIFIIRFRRWFNEQEGDFENIGSAVVTFIAEGLTKMWNWFDTTVLQWFRDRWDAIKQYFDDLRGDYESLGSAIIDGIIRGISSGATRLINAAKSAAKDAFEAAKDFLGIESPSKLFAELGDDVMAGMSLGIDRSTVDAVSSLRGAAFDLSRVDFSSPQVPVIAGSAGGQTVVNVTVTSADPQAVVEALRRYTRSNGPLGQVVTV
jgi:TP901 family phage tail tape measure protein